MTVDYRIPVSVKAVIFDGNKVWLRFNQRGEWELPGGKIDAGEQPEEAVIRELMEEMELRVGVKKILGSFLKKIPNSIDEADGVLCLIYECKPLGLAGKFEITHEGITQFKQFSVDELDSINIWPQYKEAIMKAVER